MTFYAAFSAGLVLMMVVGAVLKFLVLRESLNEEVIRAQEMRERFSAMSESELRNYLQDLDLSEQRYRQGGGETTDFILARNALANLVRR